MFLPKQGKITAATKLWIEKFAFFTGGINDFGPTIISHSSLKTEIYLAVADFSFNRTTFLDFWVPVHAFSAHGDVIAMLKPIDFLTGLALKIRATACHHKTHDQPNQAFFIFHHVLK